MDGGQLFGLIGGAYFFVLGAFAAWTAMRAVSEEDAEGLSGRVFRSLTKTTLCCGLPALLSVLWFLNDDARARGGGDSGIMSRGMGLTVLFVVGALGLLGTWVGAITLGFIGSAVVKTLRPLPAALVMLGFISGAPVLLALTTAVQAGLAPR